jgi:hypothetical protein
MAAFVASIAGKALGMISDRTVSGKLKSLPVCDTLNIRPYSPGRGSGAPGAATVDISISRFDALMLTPREGALVPRQDSL